MAVGGPAEVSALCQGFDLTGLEILDIGCGIGGVDFLLVKEHGAASVLGLDVSQHLLDLGRLRAERAGLSDKVSFRLCASPPFPVSDQLFDVVLAKGRSCIFPTSSDCFGTSRVA
jgi:phosphoethanolamine N-methyltransferase